MASYVGARGQVVIEKEIRERLGIKPGWLALQCLVDDHVELRFVPPEHSASLKGSLAPHTRVKVPPGEEWHRAREMAWVGADDAGSDSPGDSSGEPGT